MTIWKDSQILDKDFVLGILFFCNKLSRMEIIRFPQDCQIGNCEDILDILMQDGILW